MTEKLACTDRVCVHCRAHPGDTEDHWFPKSWSPSTAPPEILGWTFPSCRRCNGVLGAIEDRLRSRLALALPPDSAAAQRVLPSVHKSMNPNLGRSDRDRRARKKRRDRFFQERLDPHLVPSNSYLPGLGPAPDVPMSEAFLTGVAPADLEAFVGKLVRGLTFIQTERLITSPYEIRMKMFQPEGAQLFADQLDRTPSTIKVDFAPAIRARVARAIDDPLQGIFEFIIWERLTVYAICRSGRASK